MEKRLRRILERLLFELSTGHTGPEVWWQFRQEYYRVRGEAPEPEHQILHVLSVSPKGRYVKEVRDVVLRNRGQEPDWALTYNMVLAALWERKALESSSFNSLGEVDIGGDLVLTRKGRRMLAAFRRRRKRVDWIGRDAGRHRRVQRFLRRANRDRRRKSDVHRPRRK